MKKQLLSFLICILVVSMCIGCNSENTTTEPTDTVETTSEETTADKTEELVSESSEEPVSEPSEEPASEPSEEPTSEPSEEPVSEPSEEPASEPQVMYTYTDMSATMYATQTVNVRDLPCTDGEKIGSLSLNQEITVLGQCNETSWYMFDYNGQTAFVSNKYVSTEKVEVQQAPPAQETTQMSNVPNAADYPEGVWHDMGEYFFMIVPRSADGKIHTQEGFCDSINIILEERYPGNWVSSHSFDLPDGRAVFLGQKKQSSSCQAFVNANSR